MKSFGRKDLLAKQIMRELASIILKKKTAEDNIVISITDVELSRDLKYCKVYYSVLGDAQFRETIDDYLKKHLREFRADLAGRIRIKNVPELQFHYDDSIVRGQRIEELLNQIRKNDGEIGS